MLAKMKETIHWPQMAEDVTETVRNFTQCASNRVRLRKRTNKIHLFPVTRPLESAGIDILGPLTKSSKGSRFLLVILDMFMKLTEAIPLRKSTHCPLRSRSWRIGSSGTGTSRRCCQTVAQKSPPSSSGVCVGYWAYRTRSKHLPPQN